MTNRRITNQLSAVISINRPKPQDQIPVLGIILYRQGASIIDWRAALSRSSKIWFHLFKYIYIISQSVTRVIRMRNRRNTWWRMTAHVSHTSTSVKTIPVVIKKVLKALTGVRLKWVYLPSHIIRKTWNKLMQFLWQMNAIISYKIDHSKVSITCFFDKIMYEYVGQNNDLWTYERLSVEWRSWFAV